MEYLPGGTLKSKMGNPWNYAEAAAKLAPIARALGYAHSQKVIHRDVKPANILLNESGQPLLSDFGILKLVDPEESQGLTGTGKIVGTPAYMSPEQIQSKDVDGRADLYSLGVVFFELVTGKKPYTANTPLEVSMKHLNEPIPRARQYVRDLPVEVDQFISRALAKKPEERFQSGAAMAEALEKLARKATGATLPTAKVTNEFHRPAETKRKRSSIYIPIAAAAVVLVIGGVLLALNPGMLTGGTGISGAAGLGEPTLTQAAEATSTFTVTPVPPQVETPVPTATEQPTQAPSATPTVNLSIIRKENLGSIIEVNRLEKIDVKRLDWMKNGQYIINAGSDGISFIDPANLKVMKTFTFSSGELPLAMAISPANNKVFVLVSTRVITIDISTNKQVSEFPITGGTYSIASSGDGKLLALGMIDNKVQLVNAADGSVVKNLKSNYGGWSVVFSPDSSIVAEGTSQGILMWDQQTGMMLPLEPVGGRIECLAFSKDGKLLAGGTNKTIFLWEVSSGNILRTISGDIGKLLSLDFSPDGSLLVSGADDAMIRFWDMGNYASLRTLTGNTSAVYSVVFSPNGDYVVSGANEGIIRLWGIP
jgi:serine/threonine protein kinase